MSQLEPLIADLALILICAGVMSSFSKVSNSPSFWVTLLQDSSPRQICPTCPVLLMGTASTFGVIYRHHVLIRRTADLRYAP